METQNKSGLYFLMSMQMQLKINGKAPRRYSKTSRNRDK